MLRHARRLLAVVFLLLAALVLWRAFYYQPSRVHSQPAPAPAPVRVITPQAASQSDLILDLFNPSNASLASQRTQTKLTRQIEEALTVSFVLRRCGMLSTDDYYNTYRAMLLYIQRTHLATDAKAELDRLSESASASYALIYSRTSCDLPQLKATQAQLETWRESMLAP